MVFLSIKSETAILCVFVPDASCFDFSNNNEVLLYLKHFLLLLIFRDFGVGNLILKWKKIFWSIPQMRHRRASWERHFIKSQRIVQLSFKVCRSIWLFTFICVPQFYFPLTTLPPKGSNRIHPRNSARTLALLTIDLCCKLIKRSHQPLRQSGRYRPPRPFPTL